MHRRKVQFRAVNQFIINRDQPPLIADIYVGVYNIVVEQLTMLA